MIKNCLNEGNPNAGLFLQVLGNVGTEIDFSGKTALVSRVEAIQNDQTSALKSNAIKCIVAMSIGNPKVF